MHSLSGPAAHRQSGRKVMHWRWSDRQRLPTRAGYLPPAVRSFAARRLAHPHAHPHPASPLQTQEQGQQQQQLPPWRGGRWAALRSASARRSGRPPTAARCERHRTCAALDSLPPSHRHRTNSSALTHPVATASTPPHPAKQPVVGRLHYPAPAALKLPAGPAPSWLRPWEWEAFRPRGIPQLLHPTYAAGAAEAS